VKYYANWHRYQYAKQNSAITRSSGCTWISLAAGADASTGGKVDLWPDEVKVRLKVSEETNPKTPGWSMADAVKASSRIGVKLANRSGQGWAAVVLAHNSGLSLILQGDSDQFSNSTCSGAFDGDHAIHVHPETNSDGQWRIDDPICKTHRWEKPSVLRKYAEKLYSRIYFGVFTDAVPLLKEEDVMSSFTFKYDANGLPIVARLRFPDPAARWLRLADGTVHPVNVNWLDKVGVRARLLDPIVAGKPRTDYWMDGWVIGDNAAFVLDRNVTATMVPVGADPTIYFNQGVSAASAAALKALK
jgi:hypothetical protein